MLYLLFFLLLLSSSYATHAQQLPAKQLHTACVLMVPQRHVLFDKNKKVSDFAVAIYDGNAELMLVSFHAPRGTFITNRGLAPDVLSREKISELWNLSTTSGEKNSLGIPGFN